MFVISPSSHRQISMPHLTQKTSNLSIDFLHAQPFFIVQGSVRTSVRYVVDHASDPATTSVKNQAVGDVSGAQQAYMPLPWPYRLPQPPPSWSPATRYFSGLSVRTPQPDLIVDWLLQTRCASEVFSTRCLRAAISDVICAASLPLLCLLPAGPSFAVCVIMSSSSSVSYTHLTLPTNSRV